MLNTAAMKKPIFRLVGHFEAMYTRGMAILAVESGLQPGRNEGSPWAKNHEHWERIRVAEPESADAYRGVIRALRELNRPDEAEAVCAEARDRFRTHAGFAILYALHAQRRGNRVETLSRWVYVREKFPSLSEGWLGSCGMLRVLRRVDEADALSKMAIRLFPQHPQIAISHARIANVRRDWAEALSRWEAVRTRFPEMGEGPFGVGIALLQLGRFEEADASLIDARRMLPHVRAIATSYANISLRRRDWSEAMRRWEEIGAQFPELPKPHLIRGFAVQLAQFDQLDEMVGLRTRDGVDAPAHEASSALRPDNWASGGAPLDAGGELRALLMSF